MDTRRRFGAMAALTLGACLVAPRAVRAQTPADAVVAGSPVRQMVAAAAACPGSVDFPRPTTGRAVVQAMGASAEATCWILRGSSARDGRVTYQLTFQFADNVTVGRSFSLDTDAPVYAPPPAPAGHRGVQD